MTSLQKPIASEKHEINNLEDFDFAYEEYGLEEFEADFDLMGDDTLSVMGEDEEIEAVATDRFSEEKPQITLNQIRELEKKAIEAMKNQDADPELLKILQQAVQNEVQAEFNAKFTDAAHQQKANELKRIAFDLFQKALPMVKKEESEAIVAEEARVAAEARKDFADPLADRLMKAADKVGSVRYNLIKDTNEWATAFATLGGGWHIVDYTLKSQYEKAYTVGYHNVELHEQGADLGGYGDQSNASGGDHTHTSGDNINPKKWAELEKVHAAEAADVQDLLRDLGSVMKETDSAKRDEAWKNVLGKLSAWNEKNQDPATIYNRSRLLFDAMIGEGGEANIKKAIADKLIPTEFSEKLSAMLESCPSEVEEKSIDPDNKYHRGGTSDRNWSNERCSEFLKAAVDPNYQPVEEEDETEETSETEPKEESEGEAEPK